MEKNYSNLDDALELLKEIESCKMQEDLFNIAWAET